MKNLFEYWTGRQDSLVFPWLFAALLPIAAVTHSNSMIAKQNSSTKVRVMLCKATQKCIKILHYGYATEHENNKINNTHFIFSRPD